MNTYKKILIAILARDKEATLPLYLKCIEQLDYDKKNITLYIRTNDNADKTEEILRSFMEKHKENYSHIEFDTSAVQSDMTRHHDWNASRFKVLGGIRQESMQKTFQHGCDYYFVIDCDNFLLPHTLKALLRFDVPIISPMMRCDNGTIYSNYHFYVNEWGYIKDDPMYHHIWHRGIKGIFQVDVVHCTYLIRKDAINKLTYLDQTDRHEYVVFSDSARKNRIPQYIDNSLVYGLISFKTEVEEMKDYERNHMVILKSQYISESPMAVI